jgi:hypothetical protein
VNRLVALHTQSLSEPTASTYIDMVARSLRAARLNNTYPDRRRLQGSLLAMHSRMHRALYDQVYIDARSGLPNMAAFTRVKTDRDIAVDALGRMTGQAELDARSDEAEVFEKLARKRKYFEELTRATIAPIDEFRVLLRRHDPATGTAMFRIELTKLDAIGLYIRISIELTQVSSAWRRTVIELDEDGETAAADEAFHATVYRHASFDAETLFIRMHDIDGVSVDRVQRGVLGPVLFCLPDPEGGGPIWPQEIGHPGLREAWGPWLARLPPQRQRDPHMLVTFQSDIAARDVAEERSNDPLEPLLSARIQDSERARYHHARQRFPFRVYKDRKFVATRDLKVLAQALCKAAGTKNLIYGLR